MTSKDALATLPWKEGDPVQNLTTLLGWAETLVAAIPAVDFDACVFEVMMDGQRGVAGFGVMFTEQFSSADFDSLSLRVRRHELEPDDPLARHEHTIYWRDYPSAKEFFAAVRADPHYQFACTYPFSEAGIYAHPLAGSTKRKD
jgi:hypothetical protein